MLGRLKIFLTVVGSILATIVLLLIFVEIFDVDLAVRQAWNGFLEDSFSVGSLFLMFSLGWLLGEYYAIKKAERRFGKPWSAKWPCDKEPWQR